MSLYYTAVAKKNRDLGANPITGTIPATISELGQLTCLYVALHHGCFLYGIRAHAFVFRSFSGNRLTGTIPAAMAELVRLTAL